MCDCNGWFDDCNGCDGILQMPSKNVKKPEESKEEDKKKK